MYAKGTIPNAINIAASQFVNPDGTTKNADEIKSVFTNYHVDLSKPMVFSCNSGIKATAVFSAAMQAGATGKLSVYDGSWSEWSAKQ